MDGAQVLEVVLLGQDEDDGVVAIPPARVNLGVRKKNGLRQNVGEAVSGMSCLGESISVWPSASFHEHGFALASRTRDFESIKPSEGNVFGRVCAFSILVSDCGFTITMGQAFFLLQPSVG